MRVAGIPAPRKGLLCTDAPGTETSPQRALIWLPCPCSAQSDFSLCLLEGTQLRSQSSWGSCNFGSNCFLPFPSPLPLSLV